MMNDDLLVKCLLDEATGEERTQVQAWIEERAENARYYEDFRTIWEESRKLASRSNVDVDAAWSRFSALRAADKRQGSASSFRLGGVARIAAGIALLIAGSLVFYFNRGGNELLAIRSGAAPRTDTLPDGSVVTLNKSSELRYPRRFDGATRAVTLDGEAFFEVAPDKVHPFVITANEARVRVVGTSFNVKSNATATEVIVATGIVEVSRKAEAVRLQPHEAATVYKGRAGLQKRKTDDALYNYYRTREFVCINTPLSRLAEILEEAYDVQVDIPEPAVQALELTATFRNESLPEVLKVIGETLNIRAGQEGSRVTLTSR